MLPLLFLIPIIIVAFVIFLVFLSFVFAALKIIFYITIAIVVILGAVWLIKKLIEMGGNPGTKNQNSAPSQTCAAGEVMKEGKCQKE
jgi:hypothetical protein